jgi:hypothetical protein
MHELHGDCNLQFGIWNLVIIIARKSAKVEAEPTQCIVHVVGVRMALAFMMAMAILQSPMQQATKCKMHSHTQPHTHTTTTHTQHSTQHNTHIHTHAHTTHSTHHLATHTHTDDHPRDQGGQ